jgi:hypothetical protein
VRLASVFLPCPRKACLERALDIGHFAWAVLYDTEKSDRCFFRAMSLLRATAQDLDGESLRVW